jgi:hypothetical protein
LLEILRFRMRRERDEKTDYCDSKMM